MEGRMRPYLPELTIRDYNTYLWYLRGVRWQISAEHDLRALLVQSAAAQRGSVRTAVRQPGRAGGDLQKGAPALDALLEADDVPDPGHPPGGTGGSDDGLA